MKKYLKYIIVQAGGKGRRMGYLTENKPKALISVNAEPIIIRLMRLFPKANFLVIADYKADVLERYLKIYAPVKYRLIRVKGKGTCSGIKKCLSSIPKMEPFLITWSDLYFEKRVFPANLKLTENNYLGLSRTFPCRWSFDKDVLKEEKSNSRGIAGLFIFKNKKVILDIPESGEFCRYLKDKKVSFGPFYLDKVKEIGTPEAYQEITKSFANTRPFNKIISEDNLIIKKPIDEKGKQLAEYERSWYQELKRYQWGFIPKVVKYFPLTMRKIQGCPLFKAELSDSEKKEILTQIIRNLQEIHSISFNKKGNFYKNDHQAIIGKTKERLDSVAILIPYIESKSIFINGKKCLNFYKNWGLIEKLLPKYFPEEYRLIHGDPTFSNTLYEEKTKKTYFIDPRGYYGKMLFYGDEDYDWAKLYYSVVGNYDQFNIKNFRLKFDDKKVIINIASNGWKFLEKEFFKLINRNENKIKLYHAIIWLSLTTYVWDNYDSICGAFYNGLYLMQKAYEKVL